MADMLVKLYDIEFKFNNQLTTNGITVKNACIVNKNIILDFVKQNFEDEQSWVNECEYALFNNPISCHIAVKNKEIIGFSCYDATAKGFFGPMGVKENYRKQGVGLELLLRSLLSMKESGYAYAVIGWPVRKAIDFYIKNVNAVIIDDSPPNKSIYKNSIAQE
ncbi:MAG: GNAT family N-acetyltransferase [Lachnospiraceae bacterium]|nr:GNAT family N-acetyltransferase [Lachnospiraceae bacterium]